ncbi:MAG: hypothetical protein M1827_000799 [Pycnora praestabilis]|nr:MAG: hypothetical protein M1827_000799 [Pycnora praestabilis]
MSLFPHFPSGDFAPLFRLLDDYDVHRSTSGRQTSSIRAFQPKFDVREVKGAYELQGELPGIEQKDVSIEFVDPQTLVIKGRTEREFTSCTPPQAIEGSQESASRITIDDSDQSSSYHKPSVEEDGAISDAGTSAAGADTPTTSATETQVTKSENPVAAKSNFKYWVSERSIGEFHRSFSFPSRVDQDAVKASLKNGILSIVVPKATAPTSKRISID